MNFAISKPVISFSDSPTCVKRIWRRGEYVTTVYLNESTLINAPIFLKHFFSVFMHDLVVLTQREHGNLFSYIAGIRCTMLNIDFVLRKTLICLKEI